MEAPRYIEEGCGLPSTRKTPDLHLTINTNRMPDMSHTRRDRAPYFDAYSIRTWKTCTTCGKKWMERHTCWGRAQRKETRKTVAQKLAQLDSDSLDFMKLVSFLGGKIRRDLLDRLRKPKLTWGHDGEIRYKIYDDIPVVTRELRCNQAIRNVKQKGLLSESVSNGFVIKCAAIRQFEKTTQDSAVWRLRAVRAVLHAFPEHRHLDPAQYAVTASAILPQLGHVLQYLDHVRQELKHYNQITEAANVCLSASYFPDIGWKNRVLLFAELLGPLDQAWARVQLRRMTLARIAEKTSPAEQLCQIGLFLSRFTPCDKLSNAYFGEMRLFQARLLVDLERHVEALSALEGYQPLEPNISRLEQILLNDFSFLRGEIYRYQGEFREARQCFLQLMDQQHPEPGPRHIARINDLLCPPPPPLKLVTHLSAVSCEMGFFQHSIQFLSDELRELEERGYPPTGRNATRVRLGLAEAYIMKTANSLSSRQRHGKHMVQTNMPEMIKSKALLDHLQEQFKNSNGLGKVGKITRFRVFLASAIAEHMTGDPLQAFSSWDLVLTASRESWPEGHTDAIITYSKADLMYRIGNPDMASRLEQDAKRLLLINGPRYHFTGLGTIWPEYIQSSIQVHLRELEA